MKIIEYVFSISSKCTMCRNEAKLRTFLSASVLSLTRNKLSLENEQCEIKISEKKIKESDDLVYSLLFSSESDEEPATLLRTVREVIGNLKDEKQNSVSVLELQNDYAKERSEKLYSMIYSVENTMRKLLTRFMLENLGMKWYEAAPEKVIESVKEKGKYQWGKDCLYHIDFIQLSYFLLIPYAKEKIPWEIIKKALNSELSNEEREFVEKSIPANNWDRYFEKLVSWNSKMFETKWDKLYEFRNTIAHNRILQKNDYETGKSLCCEMQKLLNEAISKLDRVKISEEEKVNVVETMDAIFPKSILDSFSGLSKAMEPFKMAASVVNTLQIPKMTELMGIETLSKSFSQVNPVNDSLLRPIVNMQSIFSFNPNAEMQSESLLKSTDKIQSNTSQIAERITSAIAKDEVRKR